MGVLDRVTGLCFFLSWMAHLVIFLVFGFMNFFYWSLVFFFWHFPFGPCGAAPHESAIHFPVLIPFFDSSAAVGCQEYKKERKKERKTFLLFFLFLFLPFPAAVSVVLRFLVSLVSILAFSSFFFKFVVVSYILRLATLLFCFFLSVCLFPETAGK